MVARIQVNGNSSYVHKVDRFFPSSKTCSHCGYILDELPFSLAPFRMFQPHLPPFAAIHNPLLFHRSPLTYSFLRQEYPQGWHGSRCK